MPDEAQRYGDAIVVGEAEGIWSELIDDLRHRTLKTRYHSTRGELSATRVDRRLFAGKRYLPIGLVEDRRAAVSL